LGRISLLNPEMSVCIQKRHLYPRNLKRETSGDSKIAFLYCGDVLGDFDASTKASYLLAAKAAAAQDDHEFKTKCKAGKLNI